MKRAVANMLEIRKRAQKAAGSSSALDDIRSNFNQVSSIPPFRFAFLCDKALEALGGSYSALQYFAIFWWLGW